MQTLTLDQAKAIYRHAIDPGASDAEGAEWWGGVLAELKQVLAAGGVRQAAEVIGWWHNDWSTVGDTPRAAAARIRSAARQLH